MAVLYSKIVQSGLEELFSAGSQVLWLHVAGKFREQVEAVKQEGIN